jgi:hypothetical protein
MEGSDGSRYVDVRLSNLDATETAQLEKAEVKLIGCEGKPDHTKTVPVSSFFPQAQVPPRSTVTTHFSMSKSEAEGYCRADVTLSGTSSPGQIPVRGDFALVTGGDSKTAIKGSPKQQEALAKVKELLGDRKFITQEDILKLEEQGKVPRGLLIPNPSMPNPFLPSEEELEKRAKAASSSSAPHPPLPGGTPPPGGAAPPKH